MRGAPEQNLSRQVCWSVSSDEASRQVSASKHQNLEHREVQKLLKKMSNKKLTSWFPRVGTEATSYHDWLRLRRLPSASALLKKPEEAACNELQVWTTPPQPTRHTCGVELAANTENPDTTPPSTAASWRPRRRCAGLSRPKVSDQFLIGDGGCRYP
jgi:hypothetical protein